MSHFCVMVIGDDIEEQLAPYHEFECTGIDDEYIQDVDITAEAKDSDESLAEHVEDYYGIQVVPYGTKPDLAGKHKYGYALVDEQGEITKVIRRTNPNAKWDWWVLGGRWRGFLKLKPDAQDTADSRVDAALKKDIDTTGMADDAAKAAAEEYDKVHAAAGTSWKPFSFYRESITPIKDARDAYHDQEAMKNIREAKLNYFFGVDDFLMDRDQYIQEARDSVLSTYVIIKDGKWYAKGEMGWFGMSSGDMTQAEWNKKIQEMFKELPDDTLISIVDCHI